LWSKEHTTNSFSHWILDDYYTCFKANWKLMKTHIGNSLIFTTVLEKKNPQMDLNTIPLADYIDLVEKANKSIQAYMFVQNCNAHKYGSFIKNLQQGLPQEEDKYPTTLLDAKQMLLDAHKWDASWQEAKKKKDSKTFSKRQNADKERKVESD
jgi:hypothetical protein